MAIAIGAALAMAWMPAMPRWIFLAIMVLDLVAFIGIIAAKTESE